MMKKFNQFHNVSMSPWPIISSTQAMNIVLSMTWSLQHKMKMTSMWASALLAYSAFKWWKDTSKEASKEGVHLKMTAKMIKMGMVLFITSEVLFFTGFFWAYFHSSASPAINLGQAWPPLSTESFNPVNIPLLNTIILISSGVTVTWAHHFLMDKKLKKSKTMILYTCMLGLYFSFLQGMEYTQAQFDMSDSSYGSTFFLATGFHGIHVAIGTAFLMVTSVTSFKKQPSTEHHKGFEMAAWYWHFVDVVWLFLYLSIYWWGK